MSLKEDHYSDFSFVKKYDIICIQEAHIKDKTADLWKRQWPGNFFYSPGSSHGKGLVILINKKFQGNSFTEIIKDTRLLGMKIQLDDKCFNIYNVYGPSVENERYSFFALLVDTFSKWHDPNV